MKEKHLRRMIKAVGDGRVSRRTFIARMMAAGISAPLATQMLTHSGIAQAQTKFEYKPTKRGGGGPLKILYWQGPTLLNPHFAVGTKDQDGSRVFYEPLAGWDADGNLVPILAAEITADDVVFNWEYAKDPATAATTIAAYKDIKVEKVDTYTVKVSFDKPTAVWAQAFVGIFGMIIPKHQFEAYTGAKSREAPANLKPVGTGPFKFVDFKPGDLVKGEINTNYHIANQPFFDTVEIKGGGDAVSAARAVIQTGEFDMAWNMQVEDEILLKLEQNGKGKIVIVEGGNIEHIGINFTDPWTEVDGERSSLKTKHPILTDPAVRKALNLLVDRAAVEKFIYGRTGTATATFVNKPDRYRSKKTFEFSIDKANKILDDAGWAKGSDGIRAKDGKKLKFVFQTSINAPRQKTQAIIKQACQKAGIDLELKSIVASVFFSSDVGNPDTYSKFYTDIQMFTTTQPQPDPHEFLGQFVSTDVKSKDNKWQGRNYTRYQSAAFDKLYAAAGAELDPVKRAALLIEAHDQAIEDVAVIPVVYRPMVQATALNLKALFSGWDSNLSGLASWYREA